MEINLNIVRFVYREIMGSPMAEDMPFTEASNKAFSTDEAKFRSLVAQCDAGVIDLFKELHGTPTYASEVVVGLRCSVKTKFYELEVTEVERYALILECHDKGHEIKPQALIDYLVSTNYPLTLLDDIIRLYSKVSNAKPVSYLKVA